jgi:hypothetical protein
MTLPLFPNGISTNQMNVELARTDTTTLTMNENIVRDMLAGDTPNLAAAPYANLSQISFSDGHGKDAPFRASISTNANDVNVRTYLIGLGWDQAKRVVLTIDSGITVSTTSSGAGFYALTVSGSFPKGIRIVNNGTIAGKGGPGGNGGGSPATNSTSLRGTAGGSGGAALYASTAVTVINNGTIAGGGGGGGGSAGVYAVMTANAKKLWAGGPGGGGGAGGTGGPGGTRGTTTWQSPIIPAITYPTNGSSGTATAGGSGGDGGNYAFNDGSGGSGGLIWSNPPNGGSGGALGSAGTSGNSAGGAFGSATIVNGSAGGAGGAAGLAVKGSNYVTFSTLGTVAGGTETV